MSYIYRPLNPTPEASRRCPLSAIVYSRLWRLGEDLGAQRNWQVTSVRSVRDLIVLDPALNRVDIAALVEGVEVGIWIRRGCDPLMRDDANISIAHDVLTQNLNAVLYSKSVRRTRSRSPMQLTKVDLHGERTIGENWSHLFGLVWVVVVVLVDALSEHVQALTLR